MGERFTSWLSEEERAALRKLARENNTSENYIVRAAVRSIVLGLPLDRFLVEAQREATHTALERARVSA